MSELSNKEANYLAKKVFKAVKLIDNTTCLLQEITNEISKNELTNEDIEKIALAYKKISEKNPIEYMDMSMHDSFYADMDALMNKINEALENKE